MCRDGSDHLSWHSDNEAVYGPTPTIASISFGAARDFMMRK
jgi:alkylated DNA repair dioxygenase AlkB